MAHTPMASCCFCIKLKAGAIIISLLWLIDGFSGAVNNILLIAAANRGVNVYSYVSVFTIPLAIIYGFIMFSAAFGLYAITCSNVWKVLYYYSRIAYGIAAVETIMRILTIIIILMYRSKFIEDCKNTIINTSSQVEYSTDACTQGYVFSLTFAIAYGIIVILLSLYFAMVISAYTHKKKEQEDNAKFKLEDDDDYL